MAPLISRCVCQPANHEALAVPLAAITTLLAGIPLFDDLSNQEIERMAKPARRILAEKGEILFHKGDPCQGFYLIVSGKVKLVINSAFGNEKVIEIVMPGQTFGEAVMFVGQPYPLSAEALSDAHLIYVTKASVFEALESSLPLARKMITSLSIHLHHLVQTQEFNSLRSGRQRVLDYLLRQICPKQVDSSQPIIQLPASKGTIASHLGITAEHFSRVLHELAECELIVLHGKYIQLINMARIQTILDGTVSIAQPKAKPCHLVTSLRPSTTCKSSLPRMPFVSVRLVGG